MLPTLEAIERRPPLIIFPSRSVTRDKGAVVYRPFMLVTKQTGSRRLQGRDNEEAWEDWWEHNPLYKITDKPLTEEQRQRLEEFREQMELRRKRIRGEQAERQIGDWE